MKTEYAIQCFNDGEVEDVLFANSAESMDAKLSGDFVQLWHDKAVVWDISDPASPVFVKEWNA